MTATVTRAEANLLTLARVAVGAVPPLDAMRLLITPVTPPQKLGPTAREVLSDTLARGSVLALARHGGWMDRLWNTHRPPPLHFGANTVRLFSWLLSTPLAEAETAPLVLPEPLTPAEDLLMTLLLDRLRGSGCEAALARQLELRRYPLTTLAHAAVLAREVGLDEVPPFDAAALAPWIEGLRGLLARSWLTAERGKRDVVQVDVVARMGHAQALVLEAFLSALDTAGRHDLASFLIDAAVQFFAKERTVDELTRSMSTDGPLRERVEARRVSGAFLRALGKLRVWDQEHRLVRFIDDDYARAQKLVREWDRLGERGFSQAASLVAALASLS